MSKFTKSEMKKSLLENITLMEKDVNDWKWVEFEEIDLHLKQGYVIVNDEKRDFFNKMRKMKK